MAKAGVEYNRMGPNESCMPVDEVIAKYLTFKDDQRDPDA